MERSTANDETPDPAYTGLYRAAGVGLLISVLLVLLDMAMTFAGGDVPTGTMSAIDWFDQFNRNPFLGLRNLGLFNVINLTLTVPLYLALYLLHRRAASSLAMIALALVLLGAAVYCANNRALAMLSLSGEYAAAIAADRGQIAAAGTALLAQAEDFTPGSFTGFFFSSMGSILMMASMLRGRVFGRVISLTGLAGATLLLVFTILVTFAPAAFEAAMLLAMVGGLLMLAWNVLMAARMFRLGRAAGRGPLPAPAPVTR